MGIHCYVAFGFALSTLIIGFLLWSRIFAWQQQTLAHCGARLVPYDGMDFQFSKPSWLVVGRYVSVIIQAALRVAS
jgi:hypothetical protein